MEWRLFSWFPLNESKGGLGTELSLFDDGHEFLNNLFVFSPPSQQVTPFSLDNTRLTDNYDNDKILLVIIMKNTKFRLPCSKFVFWVVVPTAPANITQVKRLKENSWSLAPWKNRALWDLRLRSGESTDPYHTTADDNEGWGQIDSYLFFLGKSQPKNRVHEFTIFRPYQLLASWPEGR